MKLLIVLVFAFGLNAQEKVTATPLEVEILAHTADQLQAIQNQLNAAYEKAAAPIQKRQMEVVNAVCGRAKLKPEECNIDSATGAVTKIEKKEPPKK